MPKATSWKLEMGDVAPIEAFPPDGLPTFRDIIKLFRHFREVLGMTKRRAAVKAAALLAIANPKYTDGTEEFVLKHLQQYWDESL